MRYEFLSILKNRIKSLKPFLTVLSINLLANIPTSLLWKFIKKLKRKPSYVFP